MSREIKFRGKRLDNREWVYERNEKMNKVQNFLLEVSKLANEYDLDVFCVSEGGIYNKNKT